jgi:hypothetical protein
MSVSSITRNASTNQTEKPGRPKEKMIKSKRIGNFSRAVGMVILFVSSLASNYLRAIDIAPMTWTAASRSGWINVMSPGAYTEETHTPNATGNGSTDDTAAIQGVLNYINDHYQDLLHKTVYFPAGTYKITSTLHLTVGGSNLIGCGLNTTIKWAGPAGAAMLWHDGNGGQNSRFIGFVWDGGGSPGPAVNTSVGASCAYEEYSSVGAYMTGIRHENESFRNFTIQYGTYLTDNYNPNGMPPAAIISGFNSLAQPVGEVTIFNCYFTNCGTAIHNAVDIFNNFMWVIDGCEFENNGVGFDGGFGACYVLTNSHFQNSWVADIKGGDSLRGQRLTSSGAPQFYTGGGSSTLFEDCWVDGWTDTSGAIMFSYSGQMAVFDCSFTNPPSGALGPIWLYEDQPDGQDLLLSNNYAPAFPPGAGILHQQVATNIDWVPNGSLGGNMTSPAQTFLNSTAINDSTHILDVTSSTYNPTGANPADGSLAHDWTSSIQSAITAAKSANNGSVVYIPGGFYKISSTLTLSGGNYTIEGEGINTQLCWTGGSNGTIMTVTSPQTITVRQIHLSAAYNIAGASGYNSNFPVSDNSTVTSVKETATTATSKAVYDNVVCDAFGYGNPGATGSNAYSPGLALSALPAGSTVYMPVMNSPLTVTDCGQAQIFSKMAYMNGLVNVAGPTYPKTGFLGLMVAEGGAPDGGQTTNNGYYNFTINDNQNLLVGAYYSEQGGNDVQLLRGGGTTTGHVAIQGLQATPTPISTSVSVNNYAGRLFYGDTVLTGGNGASSVQIVQTGSNPIDMMFADDFFDGGSPPTFTLGTGANLIATLNSYGVAGTSDYAMTDTPNPLTGANLNSLASSLDDFRQLSALNLSVEYGLVNPSGLVAYWKLDETASPSADSTMSGITGTWKNSPTFSATSSNLVPYADPGSIALNGTNQYISMGNPAALPSGAHARTICGWAKSTSTATGTRVIASFGTAATSESMYIGMNGTSLVGGGDGNDVTVTNFWDTNWHFIALTYDGTTANLYADGVLKATSAKTWNLVHAACNIGAFVNATDFWKGSVDDVRIYNYALSAAQISSLTLAHGPVINVQITDGGDLPVINGTTWSSTASPFAYLGTKWSQFYSYGNISGTNLPYSDGTASTVGFTLTGIVGYANNDTTSLLPLLHEVEYSAGNMTLTITGLQAGQLYDLCLPSAYDNGNGSAITIGSQTQGTTGTIASAFINGVNYVQFTGIAPVSNSIVVTIAPNGTGQNLGILNGFQILKEVH